MSGRRLRTAAAVVLAVGAVVGLAPAGVAQAPGLTLIVPAHHDIVDLLGADATGQVTFLRLHDQMSLLETVRAGQPPVLITTRSTDQRFVYSDDHVVLLSTDRPQARHLVVYDVNSGQPAQYDYFGTEEQYLALAGGGVVMEHLRDHTLWLWPAPDAAEIRLGRLDPFSTPPSDTSAVLYAAADSRGVVVTAGRTVYYFDFANALNDVTFARPHGNGTIQVWLSPWALAFTDASSSDPAAPYELLRADRGSTTTTAVAVSSRQFNFAATSPSATDYSLWPPPTSGATHHLAHFVKPADGPAQEMGVCSCRRALASPAGGWYIDAPTRYGQDDPIAAGIWHVDDNAITAKPDPQPRAFVSLRSSSYATYVAPDVTVALSTSPAADSITCWMDDREPATCPGEVTFHETDGSHKLHVFGSNDSGDGPILTYPIIVDGTGPTSALSRPGSWTVSAAIPVAWSASDAGSGVATYDVRYQVATGSGAFGSYRYPSGWQHTGATSSTLPGAIRGKEYCFSARATDHLGNVGAWASRRCTGIPYDDRNLATATGGWSRHTASGYFAGTYTQTTTHGASLTHPSITAHRVAVVATHCPSCGAIWVYLGTHVVAKIDLHASSTSRTLTSVSFPTVSGAVKVRVVSPSALLVRLDAVGFRRT